MHAWLSLWSRKPMMRVWVRAWVCRDSELGVTPVMDWEGSREESPSLYMADRNYPHGSWDATNSPLLSSLRFQLIVSIARNLVSASQPCVTATYLPPPFTIIYWSGLHTCRSSLFQPSPFRRLSALSFCFCFCDAMDPCHTTSESIARFLSRVHTSTQRPHA